ncbi:hypothetical protein KP509_17G050400 [Ceratopteris richardii]|uniref:Pentatricopeptide repeat-containing protein n=1 Tax=Ceratopteris richardii TaxID=49495 RepID=A0A8T2SY64_CERRI|nr:hypothetical protein KP509_17G050400 [Ceratopteris richardii]
MSTFAKAHESFTMNGDINERMIEVLALEISHAITSPKEWAPGLHEKLQECRIPFTLVQTVLHELQEELLKALSFIRFIRTQPNHRKNVCLYESTLYILHKARMLATIWHLRDDMIIEGILLSFNSYKIIMWSYGLKQMSYDVITTYESMVTIHGLSTILVNCLLLLDNAINYVKSMKEVGHQLDTRTCDALVRALSTASRMKDAIRTLISSFCRNEIKEHGFKPCASSYKLLIGKLCESRSEDMAMHVLDEMISISINPTLLCFQMIKIRFYDKQDSQSAQEVLEKLIKCGLQASLKTLSILLDGHCKSKEMNRAF